MSGIFLTIYLFLSASFSVECNVEVRANNTHIAEPTQDHLIPINIEVRRLNQDDDCDRYDLGVTKGFSDNYRRRYFSGDNEIRYNIYKREYSLVTIKDVNDGILNNNVKIDFRNESIVNETIYLKYNKPGLLEELTPGFYLDIVTINVEPSRFRTTGGGSRDITNTLNVERVLGVSLVDRGAPYDESANNYLLNFGELNPGSSLGLDAIVKANTGYELSVSSDNNGRLKNTRVDDHISYEFKVNRFTRDLSSSNSNPVVIARSTGPSNEDGDSYKIDVEIQNFTNKTAGQYADFIYFNVISIE
jgi:hypothetical protein